MKLDKQDWHKLRTAIIVCAGAVLMSGLFGVMAQHYTASAEIALKNQENQLNAARQRYLSSGAEKEMITAYLPQYQALIRSGFIGEERRIEWVEQLRAEHLDHKLSDIQYNIGPQQEYKPVFASQINGFKLFRSIMKLELDMLHEGDIVLLTESLNEKNNTPFMLRECEINRLNNTAPLSKQLTPNLHAKCEIDWITLHEPVTAQPQGSP